LRFYYIARGSLNETINHILTARLLHYIAQAQFEELYALMRRTERALNGYINWVKSQRQGVAEYGDRAIREDTAQYFTLRDLEAEFGRGDEPIEEAAPNS
jgi:hypothetical protein